MLCVAGTLLACGGDDGDLAAFCATAERFATDDPAAAFTELDPSDRVATSAALRSTADDLEAWAADAPGEVDEDVALLASTARDLASLYDGALATEADEYVPVPVEDVEAASADVLAFTSDECGVDLGPLEVPPISVSG